MAEEIIALSQHYLKAKELIARPVPYIDSEEFQSLTKREIAKSRPEKVYEQESKMASPAGTSMMESPLLTPKGEAWLFRNMNYFKFLVTQRCENLNPKTATKSQIAAIEKLLAEVQETRAKIVEANTRLVASIANKFANSMSEYDELVSEGNMILVNAVDKFDFGRGFRFSTYATHAIQRHYYRFIQRRQKRKNREQAISTEILSDIVPNTEAEAPLDHTVAEALIAKFGECLDEREAAIIRERFGLNSGASSQTLKVVAERVGLSKERVRQLQMRAIEKLQDLAIQMKLKLEPSF